MAFMRASTRCETDQLNNQMIRDASIADNRFTTDSSAFIKRRTKSRRYRQTNHPVDQLATTDIHDNHEHCKEAWTMVLKTSNRRRHRQQAIQITDTVAARGSEREHDTSTKVQPVSKAEIAILQYRGFCMDNSMWRQRPLPVSLSQAHDVLADALTRTTTVSQTAAHARLADLYPQTESIGRDYVYHAFNDLDEVLFGGALKHRVYLQWSDTEQTNRTGVSTGYCAAPWSNPLRIARVSIILDNKYAWFDSGLLRKVSAGFVWAQLIHEMLHAYLMIMTGVWDYRNELKQCRCAARVYHGPLWKAATERIAEKLALPKMPAMLISYFGGKCHHWNGEYEKIQNEKRGWTEGNMQQTLE